MYMKTPMMFGRPMKKVKEYPHFVLFIDEKTVQWNVFNIGI